MFLLAADASNPMSVQILPLATAVVVALVTVIVLSLFVWPTIAKGLDERNEKILGEIKAAEDARANAKAAQEEFERKLVQAQQDADAMIKEARAQAQKAADDLRARSEAELAELKKRANAEMDAARRQAVAELEAHAAELAVSVASKILGRAIDAKDQKSLVEQSIKEFASTGR
ncbi:MAG: synthase subunit b [Planctomycetota bacterium]